LENGYFLWKDIATLRHVEEEEEVVEDESC